MKWKIVNLLLLPFLLFPFFSFSHVGYVVNTSANDILLKNLWLEKIWNAFSSNGIFLIIIIFVLITIGYLLALYISKTKTYQKISDKLHAFSKYNTYIVSVAVLIYLINLAISKEFISPFVHTTEILITLQYIIAILIILGLILKKNYITFAGSILGIIGYVASIIISKNIYIFGNAEVLSIFVYLLLACDVIKTKIIKEHVLAFGIGFSLMFLAFYEKIFNPHLSALVVEQYNLQNYIPITPELWILTSAIIETLIGLLLIIPHTRKAISIPTLLVLSMSLLIFKENVFSHITLFAIIILFILTKTQKTIF